MSKLRLINISVYQHWVPIYHYTTKISPWLGIQKQDLLLVKFIMYVTIKEVWWEELLVDIVIRDASGSVWYFCMMCYVFDAMEKASLHRSTHWLVNCLSWFLCSTAFIKDSDVVACSRFRHKDESPQYQNLYHQSYRGQCQVSQEFTSSLLWCYSIQCSWASAMTNANLYNRGDPNTKLVATHKPAFIQIHLVGEGIY